MKRTIALLVFCASLSICAANVHNEQFPEGHWGDATVNAMIDLSYDFFYLVPPTALIIPWEKETVTLKRFLGAFLISRSVAYLFSPMVRKLSDAGNKIRNERARQIRKMTLGAILLSAGVFLLAKSS